MLEEGEPGEDSETTESGLSWSEESQSQEKRYIDPSILGSTSDDDDDDEQSVELSLQARNPAFEFILAQNYYQPSSIGSDSYAKKCLESIGYDWEKSGVAECVGSAPSAFSTKKGVKGEGVRLLKESVRRTDRVLGTGKSCTIYVGGRKRCVHDGGWYDCDVSQDRRVF